MYLITNGQIVTENEILSGYDLLIDEDKIKKIAVKGEIDLNEVEEIIDAEGGFVTPGFIDIHSDYIENMISPRPRALMDFHLSIKETEKILVNQGITTMFHSLSIYDDDLFPNNKSRSLSTVRKLIDAINDTHYKKHLIRHRVHARLEINNFNAVDYLKDVINNNKVHLISFMDHTPGQGQYRNIEIYKKTMKGYKDLSENEINSLIEKKMNTEKISIDTIKELSSLARDKKISVASHDDDSIEKLDVVKDFGTTISEFPITLEIAKAAREKGFFTIAGAPNILLGGSHSGNLSAAEAIENGLVDILCSDYYPPAMLHSIFTMHEKYGQKLSDMFNLVSLNPAKAVKMDDSIGSIKEGKKADILIIRKSEGEFPVITSVFVDGKLTTITNYRM